MLNKILFKIFGLLDLIKDFLVHWGIRILLVLFFCMVLHNVVKMSEISTRYTGQYKTLVPVYEEDSKMMNMYTIGEGPKTLVILPGFGSQSPIIQSVQEPSRQPRLPLATLLRRLTHPPYALPSPAKSPRLRMA